MRKIIVLGMLSASLMSAVAEAGSQYAVWTYSAPNPARVVVSPGGTAIVQYIVTNQSYKSKNLMLKAAPGLSTSTCYLAGKGSTCILTLTINGSQIPEQGLHTGPLLCEQGNPNQCYQPSLANTLNVDLSTANNAVISLNPSSLILTNLSSGNTGVVTITNNGPIDAYEVGIVSPPGLGVNVSGSCASPLVPTDTCQLTFTSSSSTGTTTATIAGRNTNTVTESITVNAVPATTLSVTAITSPAVIAVNISGVQLAIENTGSTTAYNVVYSLPSGWNGVGTAGQCGNIAPADTCILNFVATQPNVVNTIGFSADNVSLVQSPSIAFSLSGYLVYAATAGIASVAATNDAGSTLVWDSSDDCVNNQICSSTNAISSTNGSSNTIDIVNTLTGQPGVTSTNYAAGFCYSITSDSTGPVSNGTWFLPASNELDSMYNVLFLNGFGGFSSNNYWSSTQTDAFNAQKQLFLNGAQDLAGKGSNNFDVRCTRVIAY